MAQEKLHIDFSTLYDSFSQILNYMKNKSDYYKFLNEKGVSLTTLNPGSSDYALKDDDALVALHLLEQDNNVVLGGEVLTKKNDGSLAYAMNIWGLEYVYLDWTIDKKHQSENLTTYVKRSIDFAIKAILRAKDVAENLHQECLIVLVTRD